MQLVGGTIADAAISVQVHVIVQLPQDCCQADEPMHEVRPGDLAIVPGASDVGFFTSPVLVAMPTVATIGGFGGRGPQGDGGERVLLSEGGVLIWSSKGNGKLPIARSLASDDWGNMAGGRHG